MAPTSSTLAPAPTRPAPETPGHPGRTPSSRAPGRRGSRLLALDGMRLVAALMVALYHFTGRGGTISASWGVSPSRLFPGLSELTVYGCLGVQFFFLISGFVICMSSWGRSLGDFFRSRVARLYPAYWVALVLVGAATFVLPVVMHPLRLDEFLVNVTMFQMPMGTPRVLGVCWTLWVEVRFYALFALLVVARGVTYRKVVLFCAVWTLLAVICKGAKTELTEQLVMPDYAPFFIGGLALYLIHRHGGNLLLWGLVAVSWLLGQSSATNGLWQPGTHGDFTRDPHMIVLVVTLCYAAVAAVALGWLRWASWPGLALIGALTYPFYLVHEHLGWFVIRVLHRGWGLPAWTTLTVTVSGMLVLAWLIHRYVERPLGPRLKRGLKAVR
ncbi:acyltransferase [Streptomyces sp. V3I7]|uniref:acyltransferase family protein n=1 Tax=Streptomyces sp. V3I7 TaxID=3042278 RepID=UPI00278813CE|nr:acyltransferase [Streptomyces sp. V3I7]MDQ0992669.1 peptidoglycan/LPS O-acetylase OafA/YrhL [Streptomyces sp. V3I7]